jgi:hypothetical protein
MLSGAARCRELTSYSIFSDKGAVLRKNRRPGTYQTCMTLGKSRAYGRIIRALDSHTALERMTAEQRETVREAADTLVLAEAHDHAARMALATARAVLLRARRSDCDQWIEQLSDDLEDAGAATPIATLATATGRSGTRRASRSDQAAAR